MVGFFIFRYDFNSKEKLRKKGQSIIITQRHQNQSRQSSFFSQVFGSICEGLKDMENSGSFSTFIRYFPSKDYRKSKLHTNYCSIIILKRSRNKCNSTKKDNMIISDTLKHSSQHYIAKAKQIDQPIRKALQSPTQIACFQVENIVMKKGGKNQHRNEHSSQNFNNDYSSLNYQITFHCMNIQDRFIFDLLYMDHPVTLEQERKVWTIHKSVNGTTYYYNRATKKSQYEMPECFKTTEEVLEHPDWKQYRTAQGKKFYYNAMTRKSQWQLPNEVKEYRLKLQEKRRKDREEGRLQQEQVLSEAQIIKRKFMALLKQKLIGVSTKWDACIKLCEDDDRWQLLKISDKKKYYLEYVAQLKKASDQEKRAKTEVSKNQFLKMLRENKNLTSSCRMHRVTYDFMADPRWRLLDEHERENTFQNYLDELAQKERNQADKLKKECCQAFRDALERDNIKYNTRWDEVRSKYKEDANFKALHPYDRISTFLEYIFDAEKKWEEEQVKEKRLRERVNRMKYREFLREKIQIGQVKYKTKWRDFLTDYQSSKTVQAMFDPSQQGTSPHEIFEHFMEEVQEKHKLIKGLIKHHFKRKAFKMTEQTSKQEFFQNLEDLSEFIALPEHIKGYFFHYFLMKIRSKKQTRQTNTRKSVKKQRKVIFKIFEQLQVKGQLKNKYSIENFMDHIEKNMREHGYPITSEAIFKYYLAFLQSSEQQQHRKRSKSDSSSQQKKPKTKNKMSEMDEENQFAPQRKFNIPELNKEQHEGEEQGEIKDESGQMEHKKKHRHKKRKRSSSSDSI